MFEGTVLWRRTSILEGKDTVGGRLQTSLDPAKVPAGAQRATPLPARGHYQHQRHFRTETDAASGLTRVSVTTHPGRYFLWIQRPRLTFFFTYPTAQPAEAPGFISLVYRTQTPQNFDMPLRVFADLVACSAVALDVGGIRVDFAPDQLEALQALGSRLTTVSSEQWANYLFIGFPTKRAKVSPSIKNVSPDLVRHIGSGAKDGQYPLIGRNPLTHVAIGFDQQASITEQGIRPIPSPGGASGTGLWRVTIRPALLGGPSAWLVAIFTDHLEQENLLVGTRIIYHFALIRDRWPDFRSIVPSIPYGIRFQVPNP